MTRSRQVAKASAQIGVLIDPDVKTELDRRAAAEHVSLSHYCARVLTAHLADEVAA